MYQVQRKNKIVEQLQLVHANGDIACTIDVDINVDQIGAKIERAAELVGIAQNAIMKEPNSDDAALSYTQAVISLFIAIFGEENCDKIVEFYDGKDGNQTMSKKEKAGIMTEMLVDIFPFINNEILPKVREASAERKKQLLEMAKAVNK
jgi:hypothetical protein